MATEPLIELGDETEIDEDSNGNSIVRNTRTGAEIQLTNLIDILGGDLNLNGNQLTDTTGNLQLGSTVDGNNNDLTNIGSATIEELQTTYYCSPHGSDGAAIQTALDNAANTSGFARVVVDPVDSAPYSVDTSAPLEVASKTIVELREDVKLAGGVQENIFQNANFEDDTTDDFGIWFVGKGGSLDGNKANQTVNDGSNKNHAFGFYQCGISILGAKQVWVRNIESNNNQIHGVNVSSVTDALIESCHFEGNYFSGVHSHWRQSDSTRNFNVRAIDNTVKNGGGEEGQSGAIFFSGSTGSVIANNTVRNQINNGIVVFNGGNALQVTGATVAGNIVVDVANGSNTSNPAGIRVSTSSSVGSGIEDCTISDNVINTTGATANSQRGILVISGEEPINEISITGNAAKSHGNAIELHSPGNGSLTNFNVSGNIARAVSYNYGRGVLVRNAKYGVVEGNTVSQNQGSGIFLWGDTKTVTGVELSDNTARDNGQSGSSNGTYGIRVIGTVDSCFVTDNKAFDTGGGTQTYGIYEDTNPSNNAYLLNDLRGNATAGHSLNGTSPITDAVNQNTTEDWNLT